MENRTIITPQNYSFTTGSVSHYKLASPHIKLESDGGSTAHAQMKHTFVEYHWRSNSGDKLPQFNI